MAAVHGPEVTRRPRYREALIEAAIVANAALAAYTLQHEIGSVDPHGIRAAYGVYLLGERQVWAPRSGSAECGGLAYPPSDPARVRRIRAMRSCARSGSPRCSTRAPDGQPRTR